MIRIQRRRNRLKYVGIIQQARAVEAIPVLEDYYGRTTDLDIKAEVAFALLRLGDKKNIYGDYLAADAIKRVQSNNLGVGPVDAISYVDRIAYAGSTEGIPALEDYFTRTTDPDIKAGVASALVRLGDKNEIFWTYLVTLAKPAIESDAPTPTDVGHTNSPEFTIWAEDHNLSLEAAEMLVMQELPRRLAPLAKTGDPRGVPLLRKALNSPNLFVSSIAADGLAQANDTSSVPLIIAACKRLPASVAHLLADTLLFFDDPQAQSAFCVIFPHGKYFRSKSVPRWRIRRHSAAFEAVAIAGWLPPTSQRLLSLLPTSSSARNQSTSGVPTAHQRARRLASTHGTR